MGGCATKPKVTKDNAPEPAEEAITDDAINLEKKAAHQQKPQDYTGNIKVDEVVHDDMTDAADDQANRRRSLSCLFQDNQSEGKDSTEDKKTEKKKLAEGEEKSTVQQKSSEAEKPADESQSNESEKQESAVAKQESSGESQSNEVVEQEPSETDQKEKPSEESESKETLKREPTEAEKPNEDSGMVEDTTTADDVVPEKLVEVVTEKISKEVLADEESGVVTVSTSTEDKNQAPDTVVDQDDEKSKVEVNQ